jgi:predicted NBD/HSP70 family sugar kinase
MPNTRVPSGDAPSLNGTLLSPSRIGDVNRSRVLEALCNHGPVSRADLAKMAGVTRATIGNIVQDLLDAGLVEELEPRSRSGRAGKPARPLWFAPRAGLCGAAALGPGTCEVALVNARGDVLADDILELDPMSDGGAVADTVVRGLRGVLPRRDRDLVGIGIAVPGVCDTATGAVVGSGQLPGLTGTTLSERVARRLGHRVLIDNDARAQALGEKWFGEGRGVPTFASVQTGHGLGVGLVIDGVVFRGARGETGELGHTCVVAQGGERCRCGLTGCWETIATLRWLRREAASAGLRGARRMDAAGLVAEASTSVAARDLLHRYADNLAVGLANLVQVVNPTRIILHGDAAAGGEPFRRAVAERTAARVLPYLAPGRDLVLSSLDQRAGLLGAAGLVLSETFSLST